MAVRLRSATAPDRADPMNMQRSQVFRAALVIPQTFMYRHGIELGSRGPRAVCGFIYVFGPKVAMPCDNWTLEL
ncbi:hypothetical protein C7U60_17480 [Mesorhizobium plurifarium]|nr:hypothetical protein C7U60_17480 [Mesorhizobium plurifarium]